MKLPNNKDTNVSFEKLLNYLLSETHSVGKAKARFFRSLGYNDLNANLLKQSLITIAQTEDIKETITSPHGVKYIIEGVLQTPRGDLINIRTIWIIDKGSEQPRFVTAYPI